MDDSHKSLTQLPHWRSIKYQLCSTVLLLVCSILSSLTPEIIQDNFMVIKSQCANALYDKVNATIRDNVHIANKWTITEIISEKV
jgi:hypothetical protein